MPAGHESPSGAFKPQTGLQSKCRVFSAARSPLLSRRGRRRVAAPCVCFVPWAALASCRPLPQQLLPVSAAGRGRRRCKLGAARPFQTPKLLGSIQKIQVAPLKDFLCCADLKSLARRNVMATACFHADVNAPAGSQHQQMPFAVTTLPVKKQLRNGRSRFGVANKNTISAIYAQSEAESIPNRLSRFNALSQNPPARLRRSGGAPVSAPASRRIPGGTVPETAPAPAAVRCRSPSKSRTSRW